MRDAKEALEDRKRLICADLRKSAAITLLKEKSTPKPPACSLHNVARFPLHQKFPGLAAEGMLQLFQFVLYLVQAVHQPFKLL